MTEPESVVLREILGELRGLRAGQRRQDLNETTLYLRDALRTELGGAKFTVGMLLVAIDERPHGDLSLAIERAVDLNGSRRSRETALGALLSNMAGIEVAGRRQGTRWYRVKVLRGS